MITIEPPSTAPAPTSLRKTDLRQFVARAAEAVGLSGEVHILLSDDAALRRLNKIFRNKDKSTDVLSFPAANNASGIAGDLAVSLQTAARQAAEHGHSLKEEVRILLLHGILHLAGFDHEADSGEMAAQESRLRAQLGLPSGLIERASKPATARKPARSATATPMTPRKDKAGSRR